MLLSNWLCCINNRQLKQAACPWRYTQKGKCIRDNRLATAAQEGYKRVLDAESFTQKTVTFCNLIRSVGNELCKVLHSEG